MRSVLFGAFLLAVASHCSAPGFKGVDPNGPQFDQVYALRDDERVFAYSRISPDGRALVYTSEAISASLRTLKVVDLASSRVMFKEPGFDGYWSTGGERVIYTSLQNNDVSILHYPSLAISRHVAPRSLGDYYTWATQNGHDRILTVTNNLFALSDDRAVLPASRVASCPVMGTGERPVISHDGRLISTFSDGTVLVRSVDDCSTIFDTGLDGAKADFSFDGNFLVMHRAKPVGSGYELVVVDLQTRTMRRITRSLGGSSIFPSWTKDGRLSFRYDGNGYRGFVIARNVLAAKEEPLPPSRKLPANRSWQDIFPGTAPPSTRLTMVLIWGMWSAHSGSALRELERFQRSVESSGTALTVLTAVEPFTPPSDADGIRRSGGIHLPEIPLTPRGFGLTEARNQIPTTLLFRNNLLIDRRLGAQGEESLNEWLVRLHHSEHEGREPPRTGSPRPSALGG